jgi:multiple sugar transport system ATP-binding protein
MNAGLQIDALRVRREERTVIDGLQLNAAGSELLVLAGPSGSGKSTLLRALAGLVDIDAGRITLDGERIEHLAPGRRAVGLLFQEAALLPHLDVLDNLAFGLRARGMRCGEADARARSVADTLGLTSLLVRKPQRLSGGERQRVALGRALLREPRLLLLDEPLASLDAPLRARLRAEIVELHRRLGAVTLYVTHDQAEALALADRIAVLRDGALQQIGTPDEIYARPANTFVAGFFGEPAMNWLDAEVRADGMQQALYWRGHRIAATDQSAGALQLGVRPEHVGVAGSRWASSPQPVQTLMATVRALERAGDRQFLRLDCEGTALTARIEPDWTPRIGESVALWFDPRHLHVFDRDSGVRMEV